LSDSIGKSRATSGNWAFLIVKIASRH